MGMPLKGLTPKGTALSCLRVGMLGHFMFANPIHPFNCLQGLPRCGLAHDRLTRVQQLLAGNPAPLRPSTTGKIAALD